MGLQKSMFGLRYADTQKSVKLLTLCERAGRSDGNVLVELLEVLRGCLRVRRKREDGGDEGDVFVDA